MFLFNRKSNFEILVGTTLLKQTGGEGQRIKVAKSIPHPKYDSIRLSNDIGLMKLEKPAKIGEHVHPVALGSADEAAAGVKAHVAGWGQTEVITGDTKLIEIFNSIKIQMILEISS